MFYSSYFHECCARHEYSAILHVYHERHQERHDRKRIENPRMGAKIPLMSMPYLLNFYEIYTCALCGQLDEAHKMEVLTKTEISSLRIGQPTV